MRQGVGSLLTSQSSLPPSAGVKTKEQQESASAGRRNREWYWDDYHTAAGTQESASCRHACYCSTAWCSKLRAVSLHMQQPSWGWLLQTGLPARLFIRRFLLLVQLT